VDTVIPIFNMITRGLSANRLHPNAGNPCEVAFANAWRAINSDEPLKPVLEYLVPGSTSGEQVAVATVVQWLGSPVGMGFLEWVITSSPEVRKYLQAACDSARAKEERGFSLDDALYDAVHAPVRALPQAALAANPGEAQEDEFVERPW